MQRKRPQILAISMVVLILGPRLLAQGTETPPRERLVMTAVAAFLEYAHLSKHPLDDQISEEAFVDFFRGLDPLKLYFTAQDIAEFKTREDDLDDMLRDGKPAFAYKVWKRFLTRVKERVSYVNSIIDGDFDFNTEEYFVTDPKSTTWATSTKEMEGRWHRRIKYDFLSLRLDKVEAAKAKERLHTRYTRFGERIAKENDEEVLSRFINAITACYDPHTNYMGPKSYEDFQMGVTLNYQGIGALLAEEDGIILISRVIPGGAVEKDGKLQAKDAILAVAEGPDGEFLDLHGMRVSDVVKHIRGKEGTIVRLKIKPAAGGAPVVHSLTRTRVELAETAAKSEIVERGAGPNGKPYKIGVINLPSFYRDLDGEESGKKNFRSSTRDIHRFLDEYKAKGVDVVLLDLRRNGGGFLQEAIDIAGLFIDKGVMVQVKGSDERVGKLRDHDGGSSAWEGPLVVLTSRSSASASEIVAGAIKDYDRGLVIGGKTTHGKGTVQSPVDISRRLNRPKSEKPLGVIKITRQQFYRPGGHSTQLEGVPSDIRIPSFTDVIDEGESELPHALPFDAIKPARRKVLDLVTPEFIQVLAQHSAKRQKASPYFQKLSRRLTAYLKFKKMKRIPLQEKAYQALQASLDAKDPDEKKDPEAKKEDKPKIGPWLSEALDISAEYVGLLRSRA